MIIKDTAALITGANRGFGLALARGLLERGARKVYAAARDPSSVTQSGVIAVRLDVTEPAQVAALAREAPDVCLLINNAGIDRRFGLLAPDSPAVLRAELETNVLGTLATSRAFAATLAKNGGGAILNVLSALSWIALAPSMTYSISKAAAWALTNGLRSELRAQGTQVVGLHVGYMDTDMTEGVQASKAEPEEIARVALDALEAGQDEILADETSRSVKRGLSAPRALYLGPPAAHATRIDTKVSAIPSSNT
jgi:NAD(P)-dependent dehydrogenase (short-subunit alcohol dehydrogenase family)